MTRQSSLFNISTKNFRKNNVLVIQFTEYCRIGGKWAYEEYFQKITNVPFSIGFVTSFCKDFKSL